jgi:hypothetical protein
MPSKRKSRISRKRKPTKRRRVYSRLSAREKSTYDRVSNFISDYRRGEGTPSELLRKHHLARRTVRKYGGRDIFGGTPGRPLRVSKSDRRVRLLMFPTSVGDVPIRTHSSRDATKLSEFFQDRDKLLRGKLSAESFEIKWRLVRVANRELFSDVSAILEMADADVLKLENLYASTIGEQ